LTLLTAVFAAIIATVLWYRDAPRDSMKLGPLCFMYWGASLMWLVDAFAEYIQLGAAFSEPSAEEMAAGLYLGLSVVALGLVAWLVMLLIKDPKGALRAALNKNS
jgi:hypothetical protein